ncbi:MAG: hypothetical protein ACHQ50_14365 [Fimbriimonadales bacterium]
MDPIDLMVDLGCWIAILVLALWYSTRAKHPTRTPLGAFLVFTGVFGGIMLGTLFRVLGLAYAAGLEKQSGVARVLLPMLVLAIAILAFLYARSRIGRPKTNN